ncbi:MAG TPA: AI-2E family transporter [Mesorhizobium sp.]|jgi:predicted PurR-regulated permease PerM|nr:AI-2E family transporter [Mesorhizobium sp.]
MAAPPDNTVPPASPAAPPSVPPTAAPASSSVLALQVGVVVIAGLYFGQEVLVPITVAVLLSFVLTPLVSRFRRLGLGNVFAVLLAVFIALGVILAIFGVIGTQVAQLATNLPDYVATIQGKFEAIRAFALENLSGILRRLRIGGGAAVDAVLPGPPADPALTGAPPSAVESPAAPPAAAAGEELSPWEIVTTYLSPVLSPIANAGIIFVVAIFVLLQKEDLRDRLIRLVGSSDLHRTTVAMDDAAKRLSRYFLTLLTINVGFGVGIGLGLWAIGVPNPILWGILAAMLRFIPYLGPILGALLPILLAAAVDPDWTMVLWTVALFIVGELIFNQIVEPLAYGHGTGLSPFAVIVAAIFWGWLWGAVGLILSMPLTLCLVVLGRHVERLEFLDVLLGDRPALTPIESFYQRVLAGDADEVQDHAEQLLKERPLSSYYDEVALKGLQLAANDAERGVLSHEQLERIKRTVRVVIDELGAHDDEAPETKADTKPTAGTPQDEQDIPVTPPPPSAVTATLAPIWQGDAPVLCLAGRGPLDEAASAMLAQLLAKHGLGSRVMPYQAASREEIGRLDVSGVAMVCLSYLGIGGSPSHLRYLIRRLRRKLPTTPILVGLWPADDSTLKNKDVQAVIGADHYTTSLHEAVEACVAEAHKQSGVAEPEASPRPAEPADAETFAAQTAPVAALQPG